MEKIKLFITMSDMNRFASIRDEIHDQVAGCDCCDYVALCSAFEGNDRVELIVLDNSCFKSDDVLLTGNFSYPHGSLSYPIGDIYVRESKKNDDCIVD